MRTLYLDIETSPHVAYVWGLFQQNVGLSQLITPTRMLCVAYAFDDEPMQFAAEWERGGHEGMVRRIHAALDEAEAVVHYNGTSFDEKHLNREMLEAGLTPPSPYQTIDIYRTVKQRFRFASSKLAHVAEAMEAREGKLKTDFGLWSGVLAGDKAARAEMKEYNEEDVELLRTVYPILLPWMRRHPNVALYKGEGLACTRCGSTEVIRRGYSMTGAGKFPRFQCQECGGWGRGAKRVDTTGLREA